MTIQANYGALINNASARYGIPAELIASVIKTESSGNPNAESGTGPVGLMQVSRAVAKDYGYDPQDRYDPAKNIEMGARYLADNLRTFQGNVPKALLGYNQGTNGAKQILAGKKDLPDEGWRYIRNPNFRNFVSSNVPSQYSTAENIDDVLNPVAALQSRKPSDQFSPALLDRNVAAGAPNQAEAQMGSALPITSQYAPNTEDNNQSQWGNAALAALSTLANKQPTSKTVIGNTGVSSGNSGWNNDTRQVMGILSRIGAPTWTR